MAGSGQRTVRDATAVVEAAERQRAAIREHALPAAEWFLDEPGLARREAAVEALAGHLEIDPDLAAAVVAHLIADEVDPVQQVIDPPNDRYVGVVDYAEHGWFYAFDRYDDEAGRERRAVCAHCVQAVDRDAEAAHVTRDPEEYDAGVAGVALGVHYHVDHGDRRVADVLAEDLGVHPAAFADRHGLAGPEALTVRDVTRRLDADPALRSLVAAGAPGLSVPAVDVRPGATLASGTTVGGNAVLTTASSIDADTVDGMNAGDFRW